MFQRCRFYLFFFFWIRTRSRTKAEAYWSQLKIFASRYQSRSSLSKVKMCGSNTRAILFGAHIVSVYTRLCENHKIEKNTTMGFTRRWNRQIDDVVLTGAGFVTNRFIDGESLGGASAWDTRRERGREKRHWNSVSLIYLLLPCTYIPYTRSDELKTRYHAQRSSLVCSRIVVVSVWRLPSPRGQIRNVLKASTG